MLFLASIGEEVSNRHTHTPTHPPSMCLPLDAQCQNYDRWHFDKHTVRIEPRAWLRGGKTIRWEPTLIGSQDSYVNEVTRVNEDSIEECVDVCVCLWGRGAGVDAILLIRGERRGDGERSGIVASRDSLRSLVIFATCNFQLPQAFSAGCAAPQLAFS